MNNIKQTRKTENENLRTTFKLIVSQLDSTAPYRMIHVWFCFLGVEGKIPRPIFVWDLPTADADLWVVWLRWSGFVSWMGLKLGEDVDLTKPCAIRTQALVHVCWSTQTNMLKKMLVKVTVLSLWWNVLTKSNVREENFYLAYNSRQQSIFGGKARQHLKQPVTSRSIVKNTWAACLYVHLTVLLPCIIQYPLLRKRYCSLWAGSVYIN